MGSDNNLNDDDIENDRFDKENSSQSRDRTNKKNVTEEEKQKGKEYIEKMKNQDYSSRSTLNNTNIKEIDKSIKKIEDDDKYNQKGLFNNIAEILKRYKAKITGEEFYETKTGKNLAEKHNMINQEKEKTSEQIESIDEIITDKEDHYNELYDECNNIKETLKEGKKEYEETNKLLKGIKAYVNENPQENNKETKLEIESLERKLENQEEKTKDTEENYETVHNERETAKYDIQEMEKMKKMLEDNNRLGELSKKKIEIELKKEKMPSPYVNLAKHQSIDHKIYQNEKDKVKKDNEKKKDYQRRIKDKMPSYNSRRKDILNMKHNKKDQNDYRR